MRIYALLVLSLLGYHQTVLNLLGSNPFIDWNINIAYVTYDISTNNVNYVPLSGPVAQDFSQDSFNIDPMMQQLDVLTTRTRRPFDPVTDIPQDTFRQLDPEFCKVQSRMDMDLRRSVVGSLQNGGSASFCTDANAPPWKRPNLTVKANTVAISACNLLHANFTTITDEALRQFLCFNQIESDRNLLEYTAYTTNLINAANNNSGGGLGYRYKINAASSSPNQKQASVLAPPGSLENILKSKSKKGDKIDMISNADNKTVKSFTINMTSLNSYVPSTNI